MSFSKGKGQRMTPQTSFLCMRGASLQICMYYTSGADDSVISVEVSIPAFQYVTPAFGGGSAGHIAHGAEMGTPCIRNVPSGGHWGTLHFDARKGPSTRSPNPASAPIHYKGPLF